MRWVGVVVLTVARGVALCQTGTPSHTYFVRNRNLYIFVAEGKLLCKSAVKCCFEDCMNCGGCT
jgi:hypothetical protein